MTQIFWGKVRHGAARGKDLGFPTANVALSHVIPSGIYISQTKVSEIIYSSVTFIGQAKTFNEQDYKAETYILSFDQNIYNKWISVKLLKKIRENEKFSSVEKLIQQMKKDVEVVSKYFND